MVQVTWLVLWVVFSIVLTTAQGRPRWVQGKLEEDKNEPRSPFWASILGGAKKEIKALLKPNETAEANPTADDDGNAEIMGIIDDAKKAFKKMLNNDDSAADDAADDSTPPPTPNPEEVAALVQQATEFLEKKDMNGVIDSFFGVLDLDPSRIDVKTVLGSILLQQQFYSLSIGLLYAAVLGSEWRYPPAVANLAEALRQDGENELAREVAMKGWDAAGNEDDSGTLQYVLGSIRATSGDYALASSWFLRAALAKQTNVEFWLQASTMTYPEEHKDLEFAEKILTQGIEVNPSDARLVYYMGTVMHHTDRVTEAIKYYEESLRLEPTFHRVKSTLATAYHSVRRMEEASAKYADAVQYEPENVVLLANYAMLLCSELGQVEEGSSLVEQAKQINPYHEDVLRAEMECVGASSDRTDL